MAEFDCCAGKLSQQGRGITAEPGQVSAIDGTLRIGKSSLEPMSGFPEINNEGISVGSEFLEINLVHIPGQSICCINQFVCTIQQIDEIEVLHVMQALLQGSHNATELAWS